MTDWVGETQRWFAWYPVRLLRTGRLTWLCWVRRERDLGMDLWWHLENVR